MALKLEDLLSKKKEPNQILDLSKIKIKSQEELSKYLDKVPEYKIRPEKLRAEDIRIRDGEFSFKYTKKEMKHNQKHAFPYADACPTSMKGVRLEDLSAVDISWRMLTMLRPKNRLEEDIFNRLVELGKLRLATRDLEAKQLAAVASGPPGSTSNAMQASLGIVVIKSKRGGTETRIKTCKECSLELCSGIFCKDFPYESYTRMILDKDEYDDEDAKGKKDGQRRGSKMKGGKKQGKTKNRSNAAAGATGGNPTGKNKLKRKKRKRKKKKVKPKTTSPELSEEESE